MPESVTDTELERYRTERRRRDAAHCQWQQEAKQKAMQSARRVAQCLKHAFGAERVVLFGSVAEGEMLSSRSDLDIAVEGLSSMDYYRAVAHVQSIATNGRVDLIRMEDCTSSLRTTIQKHGIEL